MRLFVNRPPLQDNRAEVTVKGSAKETEDDVFRIAVDMSPPL